MENMYQKLYVLKCLNQYVRACTCNPVKYETKIVDLGYLSTNRIIIEEKIEYPLENESERFNTMIKHNIQKCYTNNPVCNPIEPSLHSNQIKE